MSLERRYAVRCDSCHRVPSDSFNLRGYDTPRDARRAMHSRTRRIVVAIQEYERSYGYIGAGTRTIRRPIRADLCDTCYTPEGQAAYRLTLAAAPHVGEFLPVTR
jgi:hypothetical protein